MKVLTLLTVIVGGSMAAPAKLDGLDHHQHHHHDGDHHHHGHDHHHHPHDPLANLLPSSTNSAGYNYEPPAVPSGLYEVPTTSTTTTTTTTTTTPPPPPPVDSYLPPPPPVDSYLPPPPEEEPAETKPVDVIVPSDKVPDMKLMPYNFDWAVKDPDTGNTFSHVENSDGRDVTGEYSVLLPDNRLQIVRFKSDPINGYQAEVFYEPA